MKRNHARIIGGLFAAVLVAFSALAFGACVHDADNCVNTRTCPPPPDYCAEAGDAMDEIDGCN